MANILDILTRAQALRQETALNSITPDRAGGIMYDTLILINQMQLEGGSLLISKVYSSVAAMEADTTPTSDLTGRALRPGQLAVIVPSSSSSSDMGSVYRYNEPGSWTLCGKIGGLPLDTAPIQGSSNGITSGAVYNALSALRNEGYKYMGIATPGSGGTAPGTPNQPVFYVAAAGSYPNFGNLTVASGHLGFLKYSNGSWTVESIEVGKDYDEEISQLRHEVGDLETDVNGGTIKVPIDYMTIGGYNALINADNLWTGTTLYPCAIIPVTPGAVYKFVQNDNPGTIAVLKTDTYKNGTTPDFSDSYPGRILTTDIPDSLTIPSDAHFLYVRKKTAAGDVNLEMYRLDESESEGLKGRIGKVLAVIGENDMSGIYPFYINANTKQWTTHTNSIAFCYRVFKGQKVTIVANSSEYASIAFVANMNTKSGDSVQFANGTDAVQIINIVGAETYTMIEDCYLYVFKRGSSASSNRFPASITIEESEAVLFKKENKSEESGNWTYYGERPNFKTKRFGQKLLATLPAYSGRTGLHQGMAVYGDYLVLFTYDDNVSPATCTAVLYDIPSETKLAEINLPYSTYRRPHGNALSFGFGFNSENSIVPPLYISQWDEDGERGCLVYDITLSGGEYSATLIQVIIPNIDGSIFGNGYSDWVVDAENGYIYSVVYGLAVNGPYQQNDQTNPTKICKFALPSLSSSEVILTDANIVENFALRSLPYRQGLCIAGDTLMIQRGNANAGHADWLDVHFVNLAKRAITTVMPLSQFGGETEGIAVYKGKLIMGWRGNARIYEFEF